MRQSDKPAQIDEELLRITAEVQETVDGLGEAIGKRAEQLRTLIAEADTKIEQLHAAQSRRTLRSPETAVSVTASSAPIASSAAASLGGPGGMPPGRPEGSRQNDSLGGPGERSVPRPAEPQPVPVGTRGSAAEVLRLAAEGHDPETIARLTNRGREEVRLLLGTRH
ncbi:MAG TPA: hypothetical protein VFN74_00620 [Chloroflexota bacterium]|nr:hypothetical protein [Chloroflexota bacterium]